MGVGWNISLAEWKKKFNLLGSLEYLYNIERDGFIDRTIYFVMIYSSEVVAEILIFLYNGQDL